MIVSKTPRGFDLIEFLDRYGAKCSLQKSSLAEDDAIWFGIDDPEPKIMASDARKLGIETEETRGWIPYELPEELSLTTRMHLTRAQVLMLLPHLHAFVDTGEITPVGWRQHSVNYARGEKCPQTLETAQAAWDRDQELIEDQRREIERLKLKLNQERQRRGGGPSAGTVTGMAVGRHPVDVLFQYPRKPGKATHLQILKGRTENGVFKMDLDFKPDFAALEKAFARVGESAKKAAGGVSNILSRLSQQELELLASLDIPPVCEQKPKRSERVRDHKRQGKNSGKGPKGRW